MEPGDLAHQIEADLVESGALAERAAAFAGPAARYAELVSSWSRRMNLSGFREPLEIARRLILPPVLWAALLPERPASIADIGSGAGFPGIPLALWFPGTPVQLVEAREKRHFFQKQVVRELGLADVTPRLGRAEELEVATAALVTAQALAPLSEAAFHVKRWVAPGGIVAIPQSEPHPALAGTSGLEWIGCPSYSAPFLSRAGFLWISRRKS